MSEELLQRDLINNPEKIGKWNFYNIGSTTVKALKGYGIIRNIDYGKFENKKIDALIVLKKQVIAVIEYKNTNQFKTKEQKDSAIKQEIEVAEKLGSKIIIATDTKESIWVNTKTGNRIKDENGKEIKVLFDPKDEKIVQLIEKINYSINELNDYIKPKQLVNPTDLAKQIWQDIWSVSGATPENCLYTFVELFIFKYLSDLGVLQEPENFSYLFNIYEKRDTEFVLEYYANNVRPKIKNLFPENPIDKTTIINGTIFVSKDQKAVKGYSTVFKKVLEKFRNYNDGKTLENIDYDFKSQLFESFLKESISKKNWGQFFTPLKVVRAIVEMAKDEIKDGSMICDPACGVGKFLLEPIVTRLDNFYKIDKTGITPKITIHGFDKGFDKDEQKTIILAKANMLIYFSDLIRENSALTKDFAKIFNESFTLKTNSILGTLSEPIENKYDLILTNPPYVTSGSSNLKEEIKKDKELENYYKINALGVEGLFMEWIIRALKPGGKAFVVIPDGVLNRQNDKHLRKFLLDECILDGLISLPLNTFFTTNKKTYILCITKKINISEIQTAPVFTYIVSEIGETRDIYRFDIEQNDLQEAVTLFSFFKGNKINFAKINTDTRCKVQPFELFSTNIENHWTIDRWWNEEEQINLGIIQKIEKISLFDFSSLIEDVANTMQYLQVEIKELAEKKKSDLTFKTFKVKELFEIERGNGKYIKRYINSNLGEYPVYSGNTFGTFAHINTYDYDLSCLTWAIDGLAGYIMIHNEKFSATNHRGILIPKYQTINLAYSKMELEPVFRTVKKGRFGVNGKNEYTALPPFMIENIEIKLPVDEFGNFDIEKQNEIVEKYQIIKETKKKVTEYKEKILDITVEIETENNFQKFKIEKIFDLDVKTNNSKFTKSFIEKNKGDIPVYSASKFPETIDYGYIKDNLKDVKYFENCLTWNIDGSIGKAHIRKGRFCLSEKVIPLIIKNEYSTVLDIEYLKNIIETEFSKQLFNFGNKAGKGKIKEIEIPIPITEHGTFDLKTQKQIAVKYRKIEEIKNKINLELEKIQNTNIEID